MSISEIFFEVIQLAEDHSYPDIHLTVGESPIVRAGNGKLANASSINVQDFPVLTQRDIEEINSIILTEEKQQDFKENFETDTSYYYEKADSRYRVNCYKDSRGNAIAMRRIPQDIPTLESLGFGENIKTICGKSKGLVLVTGPTGSGKSTNLAGMIDYINTNFNKHIITIEDPIEFVFKNKQSLINQREIGVHTKGFGPAIKSCLREDPDIIMIGEMRDPETIKAAITLAETGHLVFSTLHTNDTVQSIDRIVDVFPTGQQEQIRMQLAMSLVSIIAQRLIPVKSKDKRVACREVLMNNDAVRNLIITGKTHQLYSVLEVGRKEGMILMDNYLSLLFKKDIIDRETLISLARDKEFIESLI